jgi:hypothetical protein
MPITASVVAITPPNAIVRKITEAIPATALHAQDSITIPAASSRGVIGYPYRGAGFFAGDITNAFFRTLKVISACVDS